VIGLALAAQVLPGETNPALTILPAAITAIAIIVAVLGGGTTPRPPPGLGGGGAPAGAPFFRVTLESPLGAPGVGYRELARLAVLREANPWLIGGIVAYLFFDVMILWATFRAFGAAPPLAIVWMAYLIGELGGLIPVPGGIGGVDAGLVGTFVLYGVSITSAASAVLAYRTIALWVPAILGSLAFVALRRTLRRESARIAVCAQQTEMEVIGLGRVVIDPAPTPP